MTTFFVDAPSFEAPDGRADGLNATSPLPGLDKVSSLSLAAGDIVALRAGAVFHLEPGKAPFVVSVKGSAAAPVTFTRYGAGPNPLIKAGGEVGVDLVDSGFVRIACINVEGGARAAVRLDARSHHASFENMDVSEAGFGFEVLGASSRFLHNNVHDLKMILNTPGGDDDYGAVAFAIQGNDNEFSFNRVWRAKAASFDYGFDGGGFEFWKSVKGVVVHHNWVEDSAGFLEAGGEGAQDELSDIQIFGNVSYNNDGFQWIHNAPSVGKFGLDVKGLSVHHNTIVEPVARQVIGFDGPVKPGSFFFTRNLVFAPLATVFNQGGRFHFDNFYELGSRPGWAGEFFGAARFLGGADGMFRVKHGEEAERFGAYSLKSGDVGFGASSCEP